MDNRQTWDLVTDTGSVIVNALTITSDGDIYGGVGWRLGITKSTDNGATWATVFSGDNPCYVFEKWPSVRMTLSLLVYWLRRQGVYER
ncbi:MAG: hypothetical protein IPO17_16945 [Flavobacteriales bacterium]|nr:hypothetical protein [Flavobacteriales bacterium]